MGKFNMKGIGLCCFLLLTVVLLDCGLMPPKRQYIKETKRQIIPQELLNTHWTLELWENKTPDCQLTMDFYVRGRFTFSWNDKVFDGDNLWYLVRDSIISFHTKPIEKIVWTTEKFELKPDNFALALRGVRHYKVDNNKLILTSTNGAFIFKRE